MLSTTSTPASLLLLLHLTAANPLQHRRLSKRIPTETAELTFFTPSSPACSVNRAATSQSLHYVITSLDKCRDLQYDLGSPFTQLQVTELSPDFADLGAEVVIYEGKECAGEVVGRSGLGEDELQEGGCYAVAPGRSVKVQIGSGEVVGFAGDCKTTAAATEKEGKNPSTGTGDGDGDRVDEDINGQSDDDESDPDRQPGGAVIEICHTGVDDPRCQP